MKKILSFALAAIMMLSTVPAFAQEQALEIVKATAILEVLEYGTRATGVLVELSEPVSVSQVKRSPVAFSFESMITTGNKYVDDGSTTFTVEGRVMGDMYVSTPDGSRAVPESNYIYIGLYPDQAVESTIHPVNAFDAGKPFEMTIRQNADITSVNGHVLPAGEFQNTDTKILLVDEFLPLSYVDEKTGLEMFYRLYIPDGYEEKSDSLTPLPLVTFLHGAGDGGTDNYKQMTQNTSALEWMRPEAQAQHPCFVLAPQSATEDWSKKLTDENGNPYYLADDSGDIVVRIIDMLSEKYNIDTSRLYLTGLSMGSNGTCAIANTYPDKFAAILMLCGVIKDFSVSDATLEKLIDKPIWILLTENEEELTLRGTKRLVDQFERLGAKINRNDGDNRFDGYLRGETAAAMAQVQIDEAAAEGANILFTYYLANTTIVDPHWSWVATYSNAAIRNWLFSQQKE